MKKILVVSGSRAEYGLLKMLIKELNNSKTFDTKFLVTGSHLSKYHGYTIKEILKDKIKIHYKIDLKIKNGKAHSIVGGVSIFLKKISFIFNKNKPDLLILLGDRYELIAPAFAALIYQIPIAHIHGGEVTNGAYDDSIRHSISKMANLHFVSNIIYKKRLMQLGENRDDIYVTGGMGVDAIKNIKYLSKLKIEKKFKIKFRQKNLIITFHPETKSLNKTKVQIKNLLQSLSKLKDTTLIFTCANADNLNNLINDEIKKFVHKEPNAHFFLSLGQQNYYSFLRFVDGVIGNSSSGILEAPSFKVATINIGNRQDGRIIARSVINTDHNQISISKAIKIMYTKKFQLKLRYVKNPYGNGGATKKILHILKKKKFFTTKKQFKDLNF